MASGGVNASHCLFLIKSIVAFHNGIRKITLQDGGKQRVHCRLEVINLAD